MPAVEARLLRRRARAFAEVSERRQGKGPAAFGSHGQLAQIVRILERRTGHHDVALVVPVEGSGGALGGRGRDRFTGLLGADAAPDKRMRVEHDLVFERRPAEGRHPAQPRRAREHGHERPLDLVLEVGLVLKSAFEGVGDHGLHVRVLDQRRDVAHARERGPDALHRVVDQLQVVLRVARGVEVDLDLDRALSRVRAGGMHRGQALQRGLQGPGDRAAHSLGRQVAGVGEHFDARERDRREDALRRVQVRPHAQNGEHRDEEEDELGTDRIREGARHI